MTQFADNVKISSTLLLTKAISRVLQKLLKHFNGTIISTLSVRASSSVWPAILF